MKYGQIVHIRLGPEDIMGCIDIVDEAKAYVPGMSLAQVVKLSIAGMLESARKHNVIPRRQGFEYIQMLQRFQGRTARKLAITDIIEHADAARISMDLGHDPRVPVDIAPRIATSARNQGQEDMFDELVVQKGRLITRQQELQLKMKGDVLNFSPAEQTELDTITQRIEQIDAELERLSKV